MQTPSLELNPFCCSQVPSGISGFHYTSPPQSIPSDTTQAKVGLSINTLTDLPVFCLFVLCVCFFLEPLLSSFSTAFVFPRLTVFFLKGVYGGVVMGA